MPPVLHGRVPKERGRQKDEAEDRPQECNEHPLEPGREEPEDEDDDARGGEGDEGEETRHGERVEGLDDGSPTWRVLARPVAHGLLVPGQVTGRRIDPELSPRGLCDVSEVTQQDGPQRVNQCQL